MKRVVPEHFVSYQGWVLFAAIWGVDTGLVTSVSLVPSTGGWLTPFAEHRNGRLTYYELIFRRSTFPPESNRKIQR